MIWLLRGDKPEKAFGGGANDKLSARGELGATFARLVAEGRIEVEAGFQVKHLAMQDGRIVIGQARHAAAVRSLRMTLIVATGFRPDLSFLRELRIGLDPRSNARPCSRR